MKKGSFGRPKTEPTTPKLRDVSAGPETPQQAILNLKNAVILPETKVAYKIVNKFTGQIGGNAHGGAIYGELTIKSMQKMTTMMEEFMNLSEASAVIDVGAGLGKPNIHFACDPCVNFSYGVEMEEVRWRLSLSNLLPLLKHDEEKKNKAKNVILEFGDITSAKTFNPFTHVYMFDIGFPGALFLKIAHMWNTSEKEAEWMVCYHGPKIMIDRYGFDLDFMFQVATSMHGSGEGHTGYFYRRKNMDELIAKADAAAAKKNVITPVSGMESMKVKDKTPNAKKKLNVAAEINAPVEPPVVIVPRKCDPMFQSAYDLVTKGGRKEMIKWVGGELEKFESSGRPVRDRKKTSFFEGKAK